MYCAKSLAEDGRPQGHHENDCYVYLIKLAKINKGISPYPLFGAGIFFLNTPI
jgi:hypothetical protein